VSTRTGMQHLTLDTGHTRASFRDELDPAVLERLRPMTVTGTHRMPLGCSAKVTVDGPAALVTVSRGEAPLVTFGVAADEKGAAELWSLIGRPGVPKPPATPWLAVKLEPGLLLHRDHADWLGDFERCWAWAWLEERADE
jgi:hypothetical protein